MDSVEEVSVQDDQFNEYEQELLEQCDHRLSELIPKRLRFSLNAALLDYGSHQPSSQSSVRPLQVFVRLRPRKGSDDTQAWVEAASATELNLLATSRSNKSALPDRMKFTNVFNQQATQEDMYDQVASKLVQELLDFSVKESVLLAYGSSGAGKTFTIQGTSTQPGLLPRSLQAVFKGRPDGCQVAISYYEIHNDAVYDLLSGMDTAQAGATQQSGAAAAAPGGAAGGANRPPLMPTLHHNNHAFNERRPGPTLKHIMLQPSQQGGRKALRVREDGKGNVVLPGLVMLPVSSADEAVGVALKAARQRAQAATGVNSSSSRSHCVFTVHLQEAAGTAPAASHNPTGRCSKLSFVDLAGTERAGRTGNQGERLRESCFINNSLTTLGRCLEALRNNQQVAAGKAATAAGGGCGGPLAAAAGGGGGVPPGKTVLIPYRESTLTRLFRDVLCGQGQLALLVAVSPWASDADEGQLVLKYAAAAAGCTVTAEAARKQDKPARETAAAAAAAVESELSETKAALSEAQAQVAALEAQVAANQQQILSLEVQVAAGQEALAEAEQVMRQELVAEMASVIRQLKANYEEQIQGLQQHLKDRDKQIQSPLESAEHDQTARQAVEVQQGVDALEGSPSQQQQQQDLAVDVQAGCLLDDAAQGMHPIQVQDATITTSSPHGKSQHNQCVGRTASRPPPHNWSSEAGQQPCAAEQQEIQQQHIKVHSQGAVEAVQLPQPRQQQLPIMMDAQVHEQQQQGEAATAAGRKGKRKAATSRGRKAQAEGSAACMDNDKDTPTSQEVNTDEAAAAAGAYRKRLRRR